MNLEFYNQIIDITCKSEKPDINSWRADQQYNGTYPEGAREKDVYFSPLKNHPDCIKSNWRYLFKLSRKQQWCPWQFWVEIIAYRLGCLIGVEVPPAHIGYNSCYHTDDTGLCVPVYGSLIEWFYDDKNVQYISGGQIMSQLIPGYDRDKGEQHNFQTIMEFFDDYNYAHWAKILTFDTLLADTDRHQDNWGIILSKDINGKLETLKFSPAFDNGTALEYSVKEENFNQYHLATKLKAHLESPKRAKHHMKWSLDDHKPLNYYEFMKKFTLKYPGTKDIIKGLLCFELKEAEDTLRPLCNIVDDEKYRLTEGRLNFMLDMIFKRKVLLKKTLGF